MSTEISKGPASATASRDSIAVHAVDICRRYGEGDTTVNALRGVSLDVLTGHLTAVMGPSGSGKSTLMHIMAGLDKPTSGSVEIDGTEITTLDDTALTRLRRKHVGFIFQFFNLLPMLTARENIVLPLEIAGTKVDPDWFNEVVTKVRLTARLNSPAVSSSEWPSRAR
jgi:putative ABC transport system ATP-binding protein